MGKKRKVSTSRSASASETKKLFTAHQKKPLNISTDTVHSTIPSEGKGLVLVESGDDGNDFENEERQDNAADTGEEEARLIESTMIELLTRRGTEKTC